MRIISRTPTASPDPVSVDNLADHLRIEATEAASAMRLAKVAADELERYAAVALFSQTIVAEATATEAAGLVLPLPITPLASITSVQDADATALAYTETGGQFPAIVLEADPGSVVRVTYAAGHGTSTADLPHDLTHALLDHALRLFDRRGDVDTMAGLAPSTARIAARYRRVSVGA